MPKPDDKIAEIGEFTLFRKTEEPFYEIVGPAVPNSPLSYTMIRTTLKTIDRIREEIKRDMAGRK